MKINIKRNTFLYFIVLLAICILFIIYRMIFQKYTVENFDDAFNPIPSIDIKNNAKINAKYEYDENTDESRIQFNVNIPQNFMKTDPDTISPYQMKGFCNALNANNETIEAKCRTLDATECANTSCCVLFGNKCVGGDENGPTYDSIYNDSTVKYKDRYYYMGKCYGNCSNYMANDYDRIYTPSQFNMGDVSEFINAGQSKQFIMDNTNLSEIPTESPSMYTYTGTTAPYSGTTAPYAGTTAPYSGTTAPYSGTTTSARYNSSTSSTSSGQTSTTSSGQTSTTSTTGSSQSSTTSSGVASQSQSQSQSTTKPK